MVWHRKTADGVYLLTLGVLLTTILLLILRYPLRINDDAGLYLDIGARILEGERPYVDYVETNLPTIHLLSAIPVAVAKMLSAHAVTVFMLITWLLVVASAGVSRWLLRAVPGDVGRDRLRVWAAPLMVAGTSLVFLWSGDNGVAMYGEREHFFVLLFTPYLLVRWLRLEDRQVPRGLAAGCGFICGVAVSTKPHFVLVLVALELALFVLAARRQRLYVTAELAGLVAYGVVFVGYWLVNLDALTVYMTELAPSIGAGYAAYGYVPPLQLVAAEGPSLVLLAVGCAAALVGRWPQRRLLWLCAAVTLGGLGAFAVQAKGWPYHVIPFAAFCVLFVIVVVAGAAASLAGRWGGARRLTAVALPALSLVVVAGLAVRTTQLDYRVYQSGGIRDVILDYSAPGDSILFMNTAVGWSYPVLQQTERRQASRYLIALPLAFGYYNADVSDVYAPDYDDPAMVDQYWLHLAQDLWAERPTLLFIPNRPCSGCRVNPLRLLEARGLLDAVIAPDYAPLGTIQQFQVFRRRNA